MAAFLRLVSASSLSESMPENSSSDSSTAVSASNSESSSKSSDSDSAYLIFFAAEARLGVFLDLGERGSTAAFLGVALGGLAATCYYTNKKKTDVDSDNKFNKA